MRTWLALAGGAAAGIAIAVLLLAVVLTTLFGFQFLSVQSGSMSPAIERGDVLIVRPVGLDTIEEGDVLVFEGEGQKIAHRVVRVNTTTVNVTDTTSGEVQTSITRRFRTKGDANGSPDARLVEEGEVVGTVLFGVPGIGFGPSGIPLQALLFAFGGLVAASWAGWEAQRLIRGRRRSVTRPDGVVAADQALLRDER